MASHWATARVGRFLGIGAGSRRARLLRSTAAVETEDEMVERHAKERREAGFPEEPGGDPPPAPRKPAKPADAGAEDDGDGDESMRTGDEEPEDNDADPEADPAEPLPGRDGRDGRDGEDGEDGEDGRDADEDEETEDDAIDREPDEKVRQARRAKARARRRRAARRAERARCARIFQAAGAKRNIDLAAELAFNTGLSSARAIAVLNRGAAGGGLGGRMAGYVMPTGAANAGGGVTAGSPSAIAASWDTTMKKVRSW